MKISKKKIILIIICLIILAVSIPILLHNLSGEGKEILVEEEDTNITISRGDVFVIEVEYCLTCGYIMWDPVYDENVFELVNTEDKSIAEGGLGGNNLIKYKFMAKKKVVDSNIKLGYYRSFEPEETWTVARDLEVTVK